MKNKLIFLALLLLLTALVPEINIVVAANTNKDIKAYLTILEKKVKVKDPDFKNFSTNRGKQLYFKKFTHPDEPFQRSCSTCHTKNITAKGSHYVSGKVIEPLSPSVNAKRLTNLKKTKKWLRRNCKWVMQGECSSKQKGDFITYLLSI